MRSTIRRAMAVVAAAAVLAGCSSDGSDGGAVTTTSATSAESTTTAAADAGSGENAEVEGYTGPVEGFYRLPDPLPSGAPGDLIRTMAIDDLDGAAGLRIMYHSTDAEGDDRATTGVVRFPVGEAPTGGWPIVAWAHGTSGLAAGCAPSRKPAEPLGFGIEGVHVATDYVGLGPDGEVHPYLSAAAEANAVIDGVVAARSIADAHAGDRWVVAGVSQGGHAALVTGERAAERLPDVDLVGTAALAPGAQLGGTFGDDLQARIITTMVLVGLAAEDSSVELSDYLGPEGLAAAKVIEDGCMGDIISDAAPHAADPGFFRVDPRTAPIGEAWLAGNDPGQVASDTPLLVVQGEADILVVPARTHALVDQLCGVGQVVHLVEVPGADHDTVVDLSADQVGAWLADRLAGEPPADDC